MPRWFLPALALAVGCSSPGHVVGVACSSDADCKLGEVSGKCEPTSYCSYPDPTCNGNRYSPGAGSGLGDTCVDGDAPCGGKDQACCAAMLCGTDLACDQASSTCVCGAQNQPCCDGTTCGSNLACAPGSTCECGAIGEPCCDGTTCGSGLSCTAGACTGGVLAISLGEAVSCALRTDHTVSCWGNDWKPYASHAVGLATPVVASEVPVTIAGLSNVVTVRVASRHACAIEMDGSLWCWGHNEDGQLGDGTTTSSLAAVQVTGMTNVTLVSGGRHHTCALGNYLSKPGLWCWGHATPGTRAGVIKDPNLSRLGNGDIVDSSVPVQVDLTAATGGGQTVRDLATGEEHSCVVLSDNTVWCWGGNNHGALGNGTTTSTRKPVPVNLTGVTIPAGVTITQVACTKYGNESTCMLLSNGKAYCWGFDTSGQLGDGTASSTDRTAPTTPVTPVAPFVQIGAGTTNYCARDSAGNVWCWGQGVRGELGNNSMSNQPSPVEVMGVANATDMQFGFRTGCVLDNRSQLFCWGNNHRFQLTSGAPDFVYTAVQVTL